MGKIALLALKKRDISIYIIIMNNDGLVSLCVCSTIFYVDLLCMLRGVAKFFYSLF